jgi:uncharacterized protein
MRLGINLVSPPSLPIVAELLQEGAADFCEIILDNFIHLHPMQVREALPAVPFSLHLVASRFLEKNLAELTEMASVVRHWIEVLGPLYVSDHLQRFTNNEGRYFPFTQELDYGREEDAVKKRVTEWQTLLNTTIHFENNASMTHKNEGQSQAQFYQQLLQATEAKLLFDITNAFIAEYNQVEQFCAWQPLYENARHFHVSGLRFDTAKQLAFDTHDGPLDENNWQLLKDFLPQLQLPESTLVIEWDAYVHKDTWRQDLLRVRELVGQV